MFFWAYKLQHWEKGNNTFCIRVCHSWWLPVRCVQGFPPCLPSLSHPFTERKGREWERLQQPQNRVTSPEYILAQTCLNRTSHTLPLFPHLGLGRPLSLLYTPCSLFSAWQAFSLGSPTTSALFRTFSFLLLKAYVAPVGSRLCRSPLTSTISPVHPTVPAG